MNTREIRRECLEQLTRFIEECTSFIGPSPHTLIELFQLLFEVYFDMFGRAKHRLINMMQYLSREKVKSGECSICKQEMELSDSAHTECHHYFHKDCIIKELKERKKCPLCRDPITQLFIPILLNSLENM